MIESMINELKALITRAESAVDATVVLGDDVGRNYDLILSALRICDEMCALHTRIRLSLQERALGKRHRLYSEDRDEFRLCRVDVKMICAGVKDSADLFFALSRIPSDIKGISVKEYLDYFENIVPKYLKKVSQK